MERRNWPWKKKSSGKAGLLSPSSSLPSQNGDNSNNTSSGPHQEMLKKVSDYQEALQASAQKLHKAEEKVNILTEKLAGALSQVAEKDELAKQQAKMAGEATTGRGKAESEVATLKHQLEEMTQLKVNADGQVVHLDAALKECMRQVRQIREEQEQKTQDMLSHNNREWEAVKAQMDARCIELERHLLASEAENKAMSKSLQERARAIVDANDGKLRAETDVKLLQVKANSLEKDISSFKYEIHLLKKEVEILNEEKAHGKKAADAAHKQHLESVKKIAKQEAECQRLRSLLRKRLPGPAALAQMKMEVDSFTNQTNRRRSIPSGFKSSPATTSSTPISDSLALMQQQDSLHVAAVKEIETLTEKLFSMDEESKLLKEVLGKRTSELQAARQLCARTATKLAMVEQQLESVGGSSAHDLPKGSHSPSITGSNSLQLPDELVLLSEPSLASISDDTCNNEDEEAESWASALMAELALFSKDDNSSNNKPINPSSIISATIATPEEENGNNHPVDIIDNPSVKTLLPVNDLLPEAARKCQGLKDKLSLIREYLKACKLDEKDVDSTLPTQIQESMSIAIDASEEVIALEEAIDGLSKSSIGVASSSDSSRTHRKLLVSNAPNLQGMVTYRLVRLFEDLAASLERRIFSKERSVTEIPEAEEEGEEGENNDSDVVKQLRNLLSSKEEVLQGKSSVMEFLLRLALMLCCLAGLEWSEELEVIHSKLVMNTEEREEGDEREGSGTEAGLAAVKTELEVVKKEKDELGVKLELAKNELAESEKLVSSLREELAGVKEGKGKLEGELSGSIASNEELKSCLEKAEAEACELRGKMESLMEETEKQKKQCEDLRQRQLQQSLSPNSNLTEAMESTRRLEDGESRLRKEREVAAAKEKLEECQRSILVLGKQLMALDSPPPEDEEVMSSSLPGGSESMDSADTTAVRRQKLAPTRRAKDSVRRHSLPLTVYGQRQELLQWSPSLDEYASGSSEHGYNGNDNGGGGSNNHHNKNALPRRLFSALAEDFYEHDFDDNMSESVAVRSHHYSPPDTAMSSPTRSPPPPSRFPPKSSSGNRRTDLAEAVRMDLSKNMNHLSASGSSNHPNNNNNNNSNNNDSSTKMAAAKSSGGGIGRLFSRNKHSRS